MFPKKISKRNKRGIIVLISLLVIITIFPRFYVWYQGSEPILVSVEELNRGVSELESKQFSSTHRKQSKKKKKYNPPVSRFDPNEYKQEDWIALGLSEKQADVVVRFAQRGIRNNDQLKQIFVIDESLFALIKDSAIYPEKKGWKTEEEAYIKKERPKVNINTAKEEELLELPGIGEFYAKKIVEYREKLGGYVSQEQLLELWKFDEEKLSKISNRIILNAVIKHININSCTAEELAKHPYIRWNVANSIVKMRSKFQKYTNFDQLLDSELISIELLEKIKPYLKLGD